MGSSSKRVLTFGTLRSTNRYASDRCPISFTGSDIYIQLGMPFTRTSYQQVFDSESSWRFTSTVSINSVGRLGYV